ncbi:MAG TPA: ABC transporter permease [Anaerolineales bacterium]|nr:ABC transporter permease [Anaerolineales bacterium]
MKILDIAFKDLTRSLRSMFAVGMMVIAPLMLTGLIYFAFGGMSGGDVSMNAIQVGVVNADRLPADSVIDAPIGDNIRSMFFDESVESWIAAADYPDEAAAREAVDKQEIGVAVIIPQDFSASYLAGEKDVQVLIVSDPTLSIGPAVVEDMVTMMVDAVGGGGIAIQTVMERQQANGLPPDPAHFQTWAQRYGDWYREFQRDLFHRPEEAALVLTAPSAGEAETVDPIQKMMGLTLAGQMIFFAFFTAAYSMMSILREDEEGTLARLFTTPTDRTSILMGKFVAVFITVILQGLVLMVAGRLAFGIRWGDPAGVGLALAGQVIAATGLGVLLIAFVKSTRQGGPVLGGGLTFLGMMGGLFTANIPGGMPAAMDVLANLTPQGWVLKTWRMVMDGQSLGDLFLPFVVMAAMGIVMFAVGAWMFRKRFA